MGIAFKERFILKRLLKVRGSVVWNHVTFWCFVTWGSMQGSWGCFYRIWYISSKLRLNLPLGLLVSPQTETSTQELLSKQQLWAGLPTAS